MRCDECGFVYEDHDRDALTELLTAKSRAVAARMRSSPPGHLRARPIEGTWSALEYGCHIRDVLLVQRERALGTLAFDRPSFPPMGRDERPALDAYNRQDPLHVADQIEMAVSMLVWVLDPLQPDEWERTLHYGYPEPAERDLVWMGRHMLHELHHHTIDIDQRLTAH
jgi:hypothetical protein